MKLKRTLNLLSILLMLVTVTFITSCDKDESPEDPADTVTLNMLDELNGKTLLGKSDVFINKSNNFRAPSTFISDAGNVPGIGVRPQPQTNNLVQEVAVLPGHLYQIFDRSTLTEFPSGALAMEIGAFYYQVYVVSPIITDNVTKGAVVKYVLVNPDPQDLPALDYNLGDLTGTDESVEIALPEGAECVFKEHPGSGEEGAFHVSTTGDKLVITLLKGPNEIRGPYGTYRTYIRQGNVYTSVIFNVK